MKARRVKKLDPDGPLGENARRIVRVRVEELRSFAPRVLDPARADTLHDMRIAAKRLRYVLEIQPAFGSVASDGARVARDLQELLGDIHDCDVMLPRVRAHVDVLRTEDALDVRMAAGARARDLKPEAALAAPNRDRYVGLEALAAYLAARRSVLFERFVRTWERLEERDLAEELMEGVSPPPGPAASARADAGAA